jgi:hypothetical protein
MDLMVFDCTAAVRLVLRIWTGAGTMKQPSPDQEEREIGTFMTCGMLIGLISVVAFALSVVTPSVVFPAHYG